MVTGASQGVGRAVALRLAHMGATVLAAARGAAPLQELVAEIERGGGRALAVACDVRSEADIQRLARSAIEGAGRLDIWVNNAGIGYFGVPLHETAPEAWTATMETNLRAAYFSIRAIAPHLIQRRGGHIINIASLAAHNPVAGGAAYAASKAALRSLSISVAEELRGYGIRVSVISPGSVDTDLSPRLVGAKDRARMLQPDDIAHAVAMLVTQSPRSFTSEVLMRPTQKP